MLNSIALQAGLSYFRTLAGIIALSTYLPLPDSLMGRLVEYVVTHEIGHILGLEDLYGAEHQDRRATRGDEVRHTRCSMEARPP